MSGCNKKRLYNGTFFLTTPIDAGELKEIETFAKYPFLPNFFACPVGP